MAESLTIPNVPQPVLDALRDVAVRRRCSVDEVALEALRATVADDDKDDGGEADAGWLAELGQEVEQRIAAAERGEVALLDGEAVFDEIEAGLGGDAA